MIVYDVTRRTSYENVKTWLREVRNCAGSNVVIILIGNKADQRHLRVVTTEEADAFAIKEKIFFMETSAFNSMNVHSSFNELLKQIYGVFKKNCSTAATGLGSKRLKTFI